MFNEHSSRRSSGRSRRSDFHSQAKSLLYSGYRTRNQDDFISRSVIARLLTGFLITCMLTVSTLATGEHTVEIARRQPDRSWLWAADQPALAP